MREQANGRSKKEIFDSWIPLEEERRKRKGGEQHGEETISNVRTILKSKAYYIAVISLKNLSLK